MVVFILIEEYTVFITVFKKGVFYEQTLFISFINIDYVSFY